MHSVNTIQDIHLGEELTISYIDPQGHTRATNSKKCKTDCYSEHDHIFKFPSDKVKEVGLPEAVEVSKDPGYLAYGLGVYHQIHYYCLNRIRKSFIQTATIPTSLSMKCCTTRITASTILCHGDIVMYWWNKNYTYIDEVGNLQYSEEHLGRTPEGRVTGAFVTWDSQLQCRNIDAINAYER
ncbi:hypothetical protein EYZ11_009186 [Aspergillus tanneri]|uniref:SET domain-containing protein n=1 Tax=Aspergillus tanneri TaxID=1220188 RepID=A0A4S3JAN9_9EURO|nr:hypothetical protein EYZ11_009186 [Aspergillus tanneri]